MKQQRILLLLLQVILVWINQAQAQTVPQCSTQCQGCGTTTMSCALISPFSDFTLIPSQVLDLTFTCLDGGALNLSGIERLTQLKDFKIQNCMTGSIASNNFAVLQTLEHLNVSDNAIAEIHPDAFRSLRNLKVLDISRNKLVTLPGSLFRDNKMLDQLYVGNNGMTSLPGSVLSGLQYFTTFIGSNNKISGVSGAFNNLPNLGAVDLSFNQLEELRDGDFDLAKLNYLYLSHNRIRSIQQKSLVTAGFETLDLAGNRLTKVDLAFFPFVNNLNLSNNLIQTLPPSFTLFLQNVNSVSLSGNPFHCNCDLEHLREYHTKNPDTITEPLACISPTRVRFSDVTSPFECTKPSVSIEQQGNGDKDVLMCRVKGDPAPKVTWYDAQTGDALVTSPPGDDVTVTVTEAVMTEDVLSGHRNLLCSAVNTVGTSEEKCFVFQLGNTNGTVNAETSDETVSLSLFIGCIVGVCIGTLCLVMYIALCCKFCSCNKSKNKQGAPQNRSHVNGNRGTVYYAHPHSIRNRKRQRSKQAASSSSRPFEYPAYPTNYGPAVPPHLHPQSQYPAPSENIYATIHDQNSNFNFPPPPRSTVKIEELPSDDDEYKEEDEIKHPQDVDTTNTPPSNKSNKKTTQPSRINELKGDDEMIDTTPSTSTTTLHPSSASHTPGHSADPLPVYTPSDPHSTSSSLPQPLRLYSASSPNFSTNPDPSAAPSSVFAANRRASDRIGGAGGFSFFQASPSSEDRLSSSRSTSASMIVTGELFVDPRDPRASRPFQGISMERTWSQEFGHEINV